MKFLRLTVFSAFILFPHPLRAQLFVDTAASAQQLAETFFDSTGVTISNVTYTGVNSAIGYFNGDNTNLDLQDGLLLTTGSVFLAVGPNNSVAEGISNGVPGDPVLTPYCGYQTYDASVLEFDLIPNDDTLFFKYVFGSEEYSEFVGAAYNDIFMFFLSGPGYADSNIAFIPGSPYYPVTVSNINCTISPFPQYYICNDPVNADCDVSFGCPSDSSETTIQYDGFTTPLPAHAIVIPGETYHARIEIADASDDSHDSGVFLSIENFGSGYPLSVQQYSNVPIQFFPDPVSSTLNIHIKWGKISRLSLFDVSGKKLLSKNIFKEDQMDVSSLTAGVYIIEYSEGNKVYHQKIIKQ